MNLQATHRHELVGGLVEAAQPRLRREEALVCQSPHHVGKPAGCEVGHLLLSRLREGKRAVKQRRSAGKAYGPQIVVVVSVRHTGMSIDEEASTGPRTCFTNGLHRAHRNGRRRCHTEPGSPISDMQDTFLETIAATASEYDCGCFKMRLDTRNAEP